jgi:hypothetical protein
MIFNPAEKSNRPALRAPFLLQGGEFFFGCLVEGLFSGLKKFTLNWLDCLSFAM